MGKRSNFRRRARDAYDTPLAATLALRPWDWFAAGYSARVAPACAKVVPIGRVSWLGNGRAGIENYAWALFDAAHIGPCRLIGRAS